MADRHGSGFRSVTRLAEARERLLDGVSPHGRTEHVPLEEADGEILAESVVADRAIPHYERAAMDGYAVRATDTHGASDRSPHRLTVVSESPGSGEAVHVNTGQALPDGADAVVMVEDVTERDGDIDVGVAVAPGENVSPIGEDVPAGRELFGAGRRLEPADVALLTAAGVREVPIRTPPTVAVIPTGEELVAADPDPGEVVETNGRMVADLVERWGGQAVKRGIVTDNRDRLAAAIERDRDCDLVVTIGGSSVGERDLVPAVLDERGEMDVHGVAIKPGHPVGFGAVDGTRVLVLPGYPVSAYVTATQLLRPAVAAAGGYDPPAIRTREATLAGKIASEPGVRTFARVSDVADDPDRVEALRVAGASVLSSVTDADGWVVVPESVEGYAAGETVTVEEWWSYCRL
ncbi:MAG: gephyrin-like molybdotransferase Glp [Halorhabdus sp.]